MSSEANTMMSGEYASSCTASSKSRGEGGSEGSSFYTTDESSSRNPPSTFNVDNGGNMNSNQSEMSTISDPSATTFSTEHPQYAKAKPPSFPSVLEEESASILDSCASTNQDYDGTGVVPKAPTSPAGPTLPLECDYDINPTELYQIIESKNWGHIQNFFDLQDPEKIKKEAATWVTRKEANGKLRWRLLPIHAAIIFQSPSSIIEKLLRECQEAARAKDDQGMLPLHLAFRTKHTCWATMEELLTSYPQAIFVKDRKGRTPLECGLAAASAAVATANAKAANQPASPANNTSMLNIPVMTPRVQKSVFSVLELYTQLTVQGQVQNCVTDSHRALETQIRTMQDSHIATLTQLKKDWEKQRNQLSRKIQGYKKEIADLRTDFNIQQELLEDKCKTEMELVDKLQQVTTALEAKTVMDEEAVQDSNFVQSNNTTELREVKRKADTLKKTNKDLLLLVEKLLGQQSSLKASLDKLCWESEAKDEERKVSLEKFLTVHQESLDLPNNYTQEWRQRLEETNEEVSLKLSQIVNQNSKGSNVKALVEKYDGEEKKQDPDTIIHKMSSCSAENRKDP